MVLVKIRKVSRKRKKKVHHNVIYFKFLVWLLSDSHVTGTGNSSVQNRPSRPTVACVAAAVV